MAANDKEDEKSFLVWKTMPMTRQEASVESFRFHTEEIAPERKTARASVFAAASAYWHDMYRSPAIEAPSPLERRAHSIEAEAVSPVHREWTREMIWAEAALCAASIRATLCEAVQRKFGTLHERVVRARKLSEKKKLFIKPDLACQLCKVRGLPDQCRRNIATLPKWKAEDRRADEYPDRASRTAEYLSRAPRRFGPPRRTGGKSV
jgi:hypothetical protein